ncbi:MAG: folylpolyglutamate synthase/dihydrofolate synthase family protein [Rikenellaceae bacterium]
MNYKQTTEYLFTAMPSFQNVGGDAYKPGLERISSFCRELGDPHLSYPTIHIAGTNGKGSTSNMLASVLRSAGYRVGLFTSPHLRDFRERMRVDGVMISEAEVVDFVAQHREAMEAMGLSFFEMTAAMALDFFARSSVDIAVVECGLGGRLDATNIVSPMLSIITNIGLDHTQYLGDTLQKIAAEKGGIIKQNVAVVVGERGEESDDVFGAIAAERGSSIHFAEDLYSATKRCERNDFQEITAVDKSGNEELFTLDLKGKYQCKNLVTLLTAIDQINAKGGGGNGNGNDNKYNISIPAIAIAEGLRCVTSSMSLEGRWQQLSAEPRVICDTGHNLHGIKEVTTQLRGEKYRKLYCVLGFARDKDLRNILPLFPDDTHFIFTRPAIERAFTIAEIATVAEELTLDFEVVDGVRSALNRAIERAAPEDLIFIGGSNFVVAEIL